MSRLTEIKPMHGLGQVAPPRGVWFLLEKFQLAPEATYVLKRRNL